MPPRPAHSRRLVGARCAQLCEHGGPRYDPACGGNSSTSINVYDAQDRLRSFGSIDYNYTDRGTLYQKLDGSELTTYVYDVLGNLTHVMEDGGPVIHYIVDARGRRVGKQVNGGLQKQYVWSPLRITAELDSNGTIRQRFIYGMHVNVPDLIVKPDAVNGDRLYRVITDQRGSPIYVVNIADPDDVLLDATYDEWGKVTSYTSSTGSWPIPFGFAGGLYDEDTGLVRFGVRDYDPEVGRWTAKDPIFFAGGQGNLYVYVGNDPINALDPLGLDPCPAGAAACMDNTWVRGQMDLYRSDRSWYGRIPIIGHIQLFFLHRGNAKYDYWSHDKPGTYYELTKDNWISSADFGNFIAGYGASLVWLDVGALLLTHAAGGYYNGEDDKSGFLGDSLRSEFMINSGYFFGDQICKK